MSERKRRRTLAVEPVKYDPDRTPKGSGSYGVMKDICEQTIDRLVSWGDSRLLAPHKDIREAAAAALAMAETFSEHLKFVNSWCDEPPDPDAKTDTINAILKLREQAMNMLQRFGANL